MASLLKCTIPFRLFRFNKICLCGCSLRVGSIFVAFIGVLLAISIIAFRLSILSSYHPPHDFDYKNKTIFDMLTDMQVLAITEYRFHSGGWLIERINYTLFEIIANIFLLLGAATSWLSFVKFSLILLYIGWFWTLIYAFVIGILLCITAYNTITTVTVVPSLISFTLQIFCISVVESYFYEQLAIIIDN